MLAAAVVTRRRAAGSYIVTDGKNSVRVFRYEEGFWRGWWLAAAEWNPSLTSEPAMTKRDAVADAKDLVLARQRGEA